MNEFDYIREFLKPLTNQVGRSLQDDAAVFSPEMGIDYVISTDTLVEKIHFFGNEDPSLLAKKALRTNLSDLAAMGAIPLYYNLSLSLPKKNIKSFLKSFSEGLRSDQKRFKIYLIGGDLTSSIIHKTFTITIIGKVPKGKVVPRNGAKIDDHLFVSGVLGLSNIGLKNIKSQKIEFKLPKKKYLTPEPRIELGCSLRKYVNCMIDVSDGLMQDAWHLANSSGLELSLDIDSIPIPEINSLKKNSILEAAMYGGDDYELLFSVSKTNVKFIKSLAKKHNIRLSEIGKFSKGKKGRIISSYGDLKTKSYMHF